MSDSLRYKILLWVVWGQIALLPVWLCMDCLIAHDQAWRWGLETWVFIVGFILGLVALPLGNGLDKPQFLKWWLRADFTVTLILALTVLFICSECMPTTIAEDDEYIVYGGNGFLRPSSRRRRSDGTRRVDVLGLESVLKSRKSRLLYGIADCKMLAVSGCTIVHPKAVYLSLINGLSNLEEAQDARFVYNRMR